MSGLPWFRMYSTIVSDIAMMMLSFDDQRHFIWLLCLKCRGDLDKKFPSSEHRDKAIAKLLGLDYLVGLEVRQRLHEADLIDVNWQPKSWDRLQYKSDISTPRVRQHREKKRVQVTEDEGGTEMKRSKSVSVTPPDTETDTEEEKKKRNPPVGGGDRSPRVWDLWDDIAGINNRPTLTKLIKLNGEVEVAKAVAVVAQQQPADPVAYIHGVLKPKKRTTAI